VYRDGKPCFSKDRFFTYTQDYKGEKPATDQATEPVTIEGSVYSMDSPAVRAKVVMFT
jgi:hypothetical protein